MCHHSAKAPKLPPPPADPEPVKQAEVQAEAAREQAQLDASRRYGAGATNITGGMLGSGRSAKRRTLGGM